MKTFEQLKSLPRYEQDKMIVELTKAKAKAKEDVKEEGKKTPELGKLYFVLECRLEEGKKAREFAPNMSLPDLLGSVLKDPKAKPDGKGMQAKNAFAYLVFLWAEIPETEYDVRYPAQVIETSGRILKEIGFDRNHPIVAELISELKNYGQKSGANVKAMLRKVVPQKKMESTDAEEHIQDLNAEGNLDIIITMMCLKHGDKISQTLRNCISMFDSVIAKAVYQNSMQIVELFPDAVDEKGNRKYDEATLNRWAEESDLWKPADKEIKVVKAADVINVESTVTETPQPVETRLLVEVNA